MKRKIKVTEENFSLCLRGLRREQSTTPDEFAEKCGVCAHTWYCWETKRNKPTIYLFLKAINALGYDLYIEPRE